MLKEEIVQQKFSWAFRGYDAAEVDFFLDELYDELTLREKEKEELEAKVEKLTAALTKLVKELPASEAAKLLAPERKQAATSVQAPELKEPPAPEKKESRWAKKRREKREVAEAVKAEEAAQAEKDAKEKAALSPQDHTEEKSQEQT